MATFVVEVKDANGRTSKEKVDADSAVQAQSIMKQKYPSVGKVSKSGDFNLDIDLSAIEERLVSVTVKDKAVFSRQFAVMVNAGVAIVRCLAILADQSGNAKMRKALNAISADVQQGIALSEAMSKHPECFNELYVSMIEAGETGGVLDEVLNRLSKLLEDIARLQGQIRSAMAYPTAVGLFALVVFFLMTIFLIPVFAEIFDSLGVELPALTRAMLFVSAVMRSWRILIPISAIMGTVIGLRAYYKTPAGRLQIDALSLKIPIFGDLNEKTAVARFCRVLGTLTRSGVPILNSMDIVGNTVGNQVIANAIASAKMEVQQGGMISLALLKENVFPPLAVQMITVGEETGDLDTMMMKVADFYEDEVEQAVKALTSLLEPIMMVVIAGMVGVILMSMYLPLFKVFDALG